MKSGSSSTSSHPKMTISITKKPTVPVNFMEAAWGKILIALNCIKNKTALPAELSKGELLSLVEDLCMNKQRDATILRLGGILDGWAAQRIRTLKSTSTVMLLSTFAFEWQCFLEEMKSIRLIFLHLDRSSSSSSSQQQQQQQQQQQSNNNNNQFVSLWDMGIQIFKKHLLNKSGWGEEVEKQEEEAEGLLLVRLIDVILNVVLVERSSSTQSEASDHYELLRMLGQMNLYHAHFEGRMLEETAKFYAEESIGLLSTVSISEYVAKVGKRLEEENYRCSTYLDPTTRKPLMKCVEENLIVNQHQDILDRGFAQLMEQNRVSDLNQLYRLFALVHYVPQLQKAFLEYIKKAGAKLTLNKKDLDGENADELINRLIAFKSDVDVIVRDAFLSEESLTKTIREGFESFLNSNEVNVIPELLAKFCDKQLRNASTKTEVLESCISIFRYMQAKDVFEEFYKKSLGKRLLLGTSASDEQERSMISKLKIECGAGFTGKLEGMFRDMDLSKELENNFKTKTSTSSSSSSSSNAIETKIHVLSQGFWPTYSDVVTFQLPKELIPEQEKFQHFYFEQFNKQRKLIWKHSLSHVLLKMTIGGNKYELDVSLFQAAVLLKFNDKPRWSLQELGEAIGFISNTAAAPINEEYLFELRRTVTSIALAKKEQRLLLRVGGGKEEEEGDGGGAGGGAGSSSKLVGLKDVFEFNYNWTSKRTRVKINQIQFKETKKENDESQERVQIDRQYQTDAAIVRIMKSRKTLPHNLLLAELFKQLNFPVKPNDLKKRIESLIDREYLERANDDPNSYVYVA